MAEIISQPLDSERVESLLNDWADREPIHLRYFARCESTNAECMRIGRHAGLVIADEQTAGRGRRGNQWHSPMAGNVYLSLGIQRAFAGELLGLVSLQVGVSVAETLHTLGVDNIALKWPNDLMLDGKKLGGILTETRPIASGEFFLVIGLGLNASRDAHVFEFIERPVASLGATTLAVQREKLIALIARRIFDDVMALDSANVDALIERFVQLDGWVGQAVSVVTRQDRVDGVYRGVAPDGQIVVQLECGELATFSAADISLRQQL